MDIRWCRLLVHEHVEYLVRLVNNRLPRFVANRLNNFFFFLVKRRFMFICTQFHFNFKLVQIKSMQSMCCCDSHIRVQCTHTCMYVCVCVMWRVNWNVIVNNFMWIVLWHSILYIPDVPKFNELVILWICDACETWMEQKKMTNEMNCVAMNSGS